MCTCEVNEPDLEIVIRMVIPLKKVEYGKQKIEYGNFRKLQCETIGSHEIS